MTEETCIICNQKAPLSQLTAGALYADGRQAFACIDHTWNRATWLLAWARFAIAQKQRSNVVSPQQADAAYGRIHLGKA